MEQYPAELMTFSVFIGPLIVQFLKRFFDIDSRYLYGFVVGIISLSYGVFTALAPEGWIELIALVSAPSFGFGTALYNNLRGSKPSELSGNPESDVR